jgi:hypothetical protein
MTDVGNVHPADCAADTDHKLQHYEQSGNNQHNIAKKLPRRKTTKRKVMRKSTKRKADVVEPSNITVREGGFGSDDDDVEEVWEEVEFSETDSENEHEREHGSSTDESDLEFESHLAEQIYSSQQVSKC